MRNIIIGKKKIGIRKPPFLIAEISGNHKKNIKRIYKIIDEASKAGFDAIKIQTYKPNTITMNLKKKRF